MVFYSQITSAISENKEGGFQVVSFSLSHAETVDAKPVVTTPEPTPLPTKHVVSTEVLPPKPMEVPKKAVEVPPKPLEVPKKALEVPPKPLVAPKKAIEVPKVAEAPPKKTSGRGMDPIAIAMTQQDPMYDIATPHIKQSLECAEAQRLEGMLDALYKSESGRSRGWVKTHLTSFLLPRAASGASVPPKEVFSWDNLRTDKQPSACLDFVCLAKGIRVAVWYEDTKEVFLWPAADATDAAKRGTPTLYHMTPHGTPLRKETVLEAGWTLRPPLSVEHSLEKLTLTELQDLAKKLGIPELHGKKTDCIKQIASERTKQRFQVA